MRFSISIPQFDYDGFDGAGLRSYLASAEELGFEGGWLIEQTVGSAPLLAPLELLAYCAAFTERLRLGVGVLVTSLHEPLQLAQSITAVDRISHGRLDVGVAPGGGARNFAAFGVDKDRFISYFTEGLELMKAAWSDEPTVTFHGQFRDVDGLGSNPKPVQRGRTRRSGSAGWRPRRWPGRYASAIRSSGPVRRPPSRSPARPRSCARNSTNSRRIPRTSSSASAST
ncbi:luciferase [Mycobacterium shigaense]|uniref:Luciferase n=1 Tax=Mycobacterium shigaense TaxID=722731 RepID=A0A1Z4EDR1_9MYCO|nr:luciferase [Mycobacterium shigaense]